jgi:hypothetical protein
MIFNKIIKRFNSLNTKEKNKEKLNLKYKENLEVINSKEKKETKENINV